ncbi:hypothetical protein DYH09_19350 [bacterium CPR1]|nr:hypothetical protein [bacterium CPR1]
MTARTLVQPLFDGPVDIVGDVHGCLEELRILMGHLGYDASGTHPESRRLVFLGDLTDRGPDNEGVVRQVKELVEGGRAQCILGNHDLNLLLESRKPENGWFFGEPREGQKAADEAVRAMVLEFFASLPLALERPDLRVIHACWDDAMLALARQATCALTLHEEQRQAIEHSFAGRSLDRIDQGLERQNKNPVKLLTSGPEARAAVPFVAGGKERWEERVRSPPPSRGRGLDGSPLDEQALARPAGSAPASAPAGNKQGRLWRKGVIVGNALFVGIKNLHRWTLLTGPSGRPMSIISVHATSSVIKDERAAKMSYSQPREMTQPEVRVDALGISS